MIIPQNIIDLVNLAISDNNITFKERELIVEAALKEGISEKEINEYINTAFKQHFQSLPKDDLLYCNHCGNQVIPTYGDCPFCGNKIISLSQKPKEETTTKPKESSSKPKESSSWRKRYEISNSHRISPKTVFLIVTTILSLTLKFISTINDKDKKNKTSYSTSTEYKYSSPPSSSVPTVISHRYPAPPNLYTTGEYYDELQHKPKLPIATLQPLSSKTTDLINDVETRKWLGYKTIYIYLRESENPSLLFIVHPMYKTEESMYRLTITDTLGNAIIGIPYVDFEGKYEKNTLSIIEAEFVVDNKKDKHNEILHRLRNLQSNYNNMRYSISALY